MRSTIVVFAVMTLAGCCPPMGSAAAVAAGCCKEVRGAPQPHPQPPPREVGAASQPSASYPGREVGASSQPSSAPRATPAPTRATPPVATPVKPAPARPEPVVQHDSTCVPCGEYATGYTCRADGKSLAFCTGPDGCLTITKCARGCKVASSDSPESDQCR